jgi:hypothetical protein
MAIKAAQLVLYSIILSLSVFFINYIFREQSSIKSLLFQFGESVNYGIVNKHEIFRFKSKIVRPLYNVSCRQIFEMNSVGIFKINNS